MNMFTGGYAAFLTDLIDQFYLFVDKTVIKHEE